MPSPDAVALAEDAIARVLEHHDVERTDLVEVAVARAHDARTNPVEDARRETRVADASEQIDVDLTEVIPDECERAEAIATALKRSAGVGLLGQRVSLGSLLREGVPPVKWLESSTLGERLFYRESLFIVSGHKKSGKSWAMLATALDCVRAGRPVVYLDFENGRRLFVKRLGLLGAAPEEVDEHLHYIEFPQGLSADRMGEQIETLAEGAPGAFVVVDSLRGYMARLSPASKPLDPNAAQDIEAVCRPLMEAAKVHGLTVGVIDHARKDASDKDEFSTSGSQAKEAGVDAVYFWTKVEPFNIEHEGLVKIKATSDRDGELDFERYWRVGGQGQGQPVRFRRVDNDEVGTMGKTRSDIFAFLADREGEAFSKSAIVGAVGGKAETARKALELVVAAEENVHKLPHPTRGDWSVYTYDPARTPGAGLPV